MSNQELAQELHKPIIRKLEKRKIHSSFTDKIWVADLADMQLISKFDKEFVLNKEFYKEFHYVLLIFIVNVRPLFLWKIKKVLQLLMLLKTF